MKWILLIIALISLPTVAAASIQGTIYDFSLNPASAVVSIDTVPQQVVVAIDGNYVFTLPLGSYTITAEVRSGNTLVEGAKEDITITEDGEYSFDIILLPSLDDEIVPELGVSEEIAEEPSTNWYGLIILLIIFIFFIFIIGFKKNKSRKHLQSLKGQPDPQLEVSHSSSPTNIDTDAQNILRFIQQHKRTTQKEIRREFSSSEAKISLILTELASREKIHKIKKGRGNVIIVNEKE